MSCASETSIFGPTLLTGVQWNVPLAYANLDFSGILGVLTDALDANGNPIILPEDLTGCQLDCYITDPNDNQLVVQWSSGGVSPVYTLVDQAVYPDANYTLSVLNSTLNALFTARAYICAWILTKADSTEVILFQGEVIFS